MWKQLVITCLLAVAFGATPQDGGAITPGKAPVVAGEELSRMQSQPVNDVHTHFAATAAKKEETKPEAKPEPANQIPPPPTKLDENLVAHEENAEDGKATTGAVPPSSIAFQGDAPVGGSDKLSTAGKCYLALATLFFAVNAIIYVSRELKVRGIELPQSVIGDIIFNEERLNNSKSALIFIPVLAVLMLFIMFRARLQMVDGTGLVTPGVQNGMVLATMGIYMQALDIMDIRITSDAFGNLSEKIGMLFVYIGYGICVYGLFTVKDPAKPVSVAAQCILALCTLVFILQLLVKYLQNKAMLANMVPAVPSLPVKVPGMGGEGAPAGAGFSVPDVPGSDLMKGMFDESKLSSAITTCEFVPLVAMVYMFLHLNTVLSFGDGARPPDYARYAMYGGAAGIYLQTLACILLRDLNKTLGTTARSLGLLVTYAGFVVTLIYALSITPGEMGNAGVLGMLYMCTAVLVFKAATVALEEVADTPMAATMEAFQQYKETLAAAGQVLQYATILGILMIYIHFRARIILFLPALPEWVTYMELCAMICLFLQVCMVMLGSVMGESAMTAVLKALTMLGLYVGFGGIVVAAFVLERPVA